MLRNLVIFIFTVAFLFQAPGLLSQANAHSITTNSYPDNGNTVFEFTVTSGTKPSISHWVIPACEDLTEDMIISTSESSEFGTDPTTGVYGIKFDEGYKDGEERTVFLTLKGSWSSGSVVVTIKAGQEEPTLEITGPICEPLDEKLKLTSICHVEDVGIMRLRNPNDHDFDVMWQKYPGAWQGPVVAKANEDTFFEVPWPGTIKIKYDLNGQTKEDVKAQNNKICDSKLTLTSICHVEDVGTMRLRNPNDHDIDVMWEKYGDGIGWRGPVVAKANEDTFFEVPWPGTIKIKYDLNGQTKEDVKAQNNELCELDEKLTLTSICHVEDVGTMRLRNPNDHDVDVMWEKYGDGIGWRGPVVAKANEDTFFKVPWPGTIKIKYDLNGQTKEDVKAQNNELCELDEKLTLTSICHVEDVGRMRLRNPNDHDFDVMWQKYPGEWQCPVVAKANEDTFFEVPWPGTIKIKYDLNGKTKEDVKAQNNEICEPLGGCLDVWVKENGKPGKYLVAAKSLDTDQKGAKQYTDEDGYIYFHNINFGRVQIDVWRYIPGPDNNEFLYSKVIEHKESGACTKLVLNIGECKPVYAWYQAWYSNTATDPLLRYWSETNLGGVVDTAAFKNYDSTDPDIWEYHILLAWAADIDAFIVDWYGKDSYEQSPTRGLLKAAQHLYEMYGDKGFDFKIAIAYNEKAEGDLNSNLMFINDSILTHPSYWGNRSGEDRPVFVYSTGTELTAPEFTRAADQYLPADVLVIWNWDSDQTNLVDYVDSVYPWVQAKDILFEPNGLEWGEAYLESFYGTAPTLPVQFSTGAVWPGLDDRKWTAGMDDWADRQDTLVFEWTWDKAFNYQPEWLIIQTWNDFNRGTHVETSENYGYKFVKMTRNKTNIWKAQCGRNFPDKGLMVPEKVYMARKVPFLAALIDPALDAFFDRQFDRALAMLNTNVENFEPEEPTEMDNSLVFVYGTETFKKGQEVYPWDNALSGNGRVVANIKNGELPYAVFRFADGNAYKFNAIKWAVPATPVRGALTDRIQVYVSMDGQTWDNLGVHIKRHGSPVWWLLDHWVTAKYVKLRLVYPHWAHMLEISEFKLTTHSKGDVVPASQDNMVQAVPNVYKLEQNYPNPFNPETTIKFQLPEAQHVTITIYDIAGREIVRLVDEYRQAGSYQTTWKARNVASGVYFYRIQAGHFQDIKRLVLLK